MQCSIDFAIASVTELAAAIEELTGIKTRQRGRRVWKQQAAIVITTEEGTPNSSYSFTACRIHPYFGRDHCFPSDRTLPSFLRVLQFGTTVASSFIVEGSSYSCFQHIH
jgi:hypothetical protein